jgi:hypothetical protein
LRRLPLLWVVVMLERRCCWGDTGLLKMQSCYSVRRVLRSGLYIAVGYTGDVEHPPPRRPHLVVREPEASYGVPS